jgi:hypothetical protein
MIRNVVLAVVALAPSLAAAQVVFEPVRYQYHGDRSTFYYGGSDPSVIAYGKQVDELRPQTSPAADDYTRPILRSRVYSDVVPFWNAAIYGWSPSDARNEANASLPRYFRKRDLFPLPSDVRGLITVPAQAQPVRLTPTTRVEPKTVTRPSPILIIPKDALRKPAAPVKQAMFVAVSLDSTAPVSR